MTQTPHWPPAPTGLCALTGLTLFLARWSLHSSAIRSFFWATWRAPESVFLV